MSELVALAVQPRSTTGTKAAKKTRAAGMIPGIVYGHKQDPVSVSVPAKELDHAIRVQHARTFEITLNGKKETVLIRELQWCHLGKEMYHIDLWRVDAAERVKVTVPVELRGAPKTTGGGVLEQPLHLLHIECFALKIPEAFRVDIEGLTLGHPIHVRDLALPEGVKVLDPAEAVVVQLKLPGQEEATEPAADAAEPEVLTAKKPKDGEAEEK
ncbi:MAG: 50S ribosomal protein L25 [Fimbriiglobus sp.]|nr:50S ribosomal protein L25 [Fimbriiglobus sp.]